MTERQQRALPEVMERREQMFDECIAQYESDNDPAILETWLQFVPDEAARVDHIAERLAAPRTLEELVEETLHLNSTLCDAYLMLAREAPTPDLCDLFGDLARIEERNDCHYAKMLLDA